MDKQSVKRRLVVTKKVLEEYTCMCAHQKQILEAFVHDIEGREQILKSVKGQDIPKDIVYEQGINNLKNQAEKQLIALEKYIGNCAMANKMITVYEQMLATGKPWAQVISEIIA